MTIQEVVDAVLDAVPGEKAGDTVDTLKCGNPNAEVTGIVTTFIATRAVLAEADRLGANLVITHEPTFYNHRDETGPLIGDPIFESKRGFLEEERMAIFRFHDYWHRHRPDGILEGFARKLGWSEHQDRENESVFHLPPIRLRDLAKMLRKKLRASSLRVAGDPEMLCRGVATCLGSGPWEWHWRALRQESVDVLICGESAEWQACEYVRDAAAAARRKGLIVLGHCNSEEPGMEYLAEWLRPLVPGVRVTFVPAGDPFWGA